MEIRKMSEQEKTQKPPAEQSKEKDQNIKITVDNEQTKILAEQLAKAQNEKKEMEDKLAKIEADKKVQDEAAKKLAEETEDLKNKLGIIAEKELEKKRNSVKEKANALLKDPERVKEIESKLSTPEGIAAMEYTMNVLEKQMKVGEEQFKTYQEGERKKAEEAAAKAKADADAAAKVAADAAAAGKPAPETKPPSGTAPLNAAQLGNPQPTDLMHMKFDSYGAMVRYLQELEQGSDKLRAAEAKVALNDLLKKWASLVKQNYEAQRSPPMETSDKLPSIKELTLSKRAQEELRRRQQGGQAENVTNG
jgi:hypothetical protein